METPWAKVPAGEKKTLEIAPEAFRIISKYAAKRGLMTNKTPGEVVESILKEFRIEETT